MYAALDVPVAAVHLSETATDKTANSSATAASMGSDLYCAAVLDACSQLRDRMNRYFRERVPRPPAGA